MGWGGGVGGAGLNEFKQEIILILRLLQQQLENMEAQNSQMSHCHQRSHHVVHRDRVRRAECHMTNQLRYERAPRASRPPPR